MESRPVKIYSTDNVPRLSYVAGIILEDILGLSWELITDKRRLGKNNIINYSSEKLEGAFKISPHPLLFEKGITHQTITVNEWKGLPVFFQTPPDSDLPFDIFAASFYLISRYEEYLGFKADEHGRFKASSSLAFQNGFLGKPVIDQWAKELAKTLLKKFQTLVFKSNEFRSLLTIDTDQPFAFRGKTLIRSLGGFFRDITNNEKHVGERYRIIAGEEKDPFDVFDYIFENIEKYKTKALFFFPVGDHSDYDKNPSWKNDEYRKLITRVADKFETGLHPSYYAPEKVNLIDNELTRLKTILQKDIAISRFHYLRFFLPQSYRYLTETGIMEDYSMGYADEPGFRAGIARPFYFYDLPEDKQTKLKIIPFQLMDATLYQYKNLDPETAMELVMDLISETRKAGGLFVSIWHNTSLLDSPDCQGWREVFEFMLKNQVP